jgi:hypothetical protein
LCDFYSTNTKEQIPINRYLSAISPNGRPYATLPERIRRACAKDIRRFASEGNVVERSERYASVAKPKGPQDFKAFPRTGLLAACTKRS